MAQVRLPKTADPPDDRTLMGRFAAGRDEAAFAALVSRHGPAVFGVCRQVLGDAHAAEDAYQATFLILARRAASVRPGQVGAWLVGVAYRVARKARTAEARRLRREVRAARPERLDAAAVDDTHAVLLDEVNRLAEKYRLPVLLCGLEGKRRQEAASLLGWPEGTLQTRLNKARRLLAERLSRRGVALSAVALTPALASTACRLGATVVPARVVEFAAPFLGGIMLKKWIALAAVVTAVGMFGVGPGPRGGATPAADAAPPAGEDPAIEKLLKRRVAVLKQEVEMRLNQWRFGREAIDDVLLAHRRLNVARLELARSRQARVKILGETYVLAKALYRLSKARFDSGRLTKSDTFRAEAVMLRAEIDLRRAAGDPAKADKAVLRKYGLGGSD